MQTLPATHAAGKSDFPPAPLKPNRSARLLSWQGGKGRLSITERKKTDEYLVERFPSDFGEGYFLLKTSDPAADVYAVNLDRAHGFHSCECKGYLRHGHCRHVEVLLALGVAGKLS